MNRNIKRIFVSILAATTIFTASGPVFANNISVNMPYTIYQTIDKENISSGVVYEKIMKFTTAGWWNINVLRVDLQDPYTDVKGLINPEGLPKMDKISSLVEKNNALAGINGDFFDWTPLPWALSTLINDREVISSPRHISFNSPTFLIDLLNQAQITYLDRKMTITNLTKDKTIEIVSINKSTKEFDTVTLYNKYFGPKSIGTKFHNDLIEVVVQNNIVIDVRVGQEAVDIPEDGYVLAVRGNNNQGLNQFSIGDYVEFKVDASKNIDDIKFAIGGGSNILVNGELRKPELNLPGDQPRTGIGISKDGKEIILVTIDGRDTSFKGVTQEMFGAILRDLGAYNAINLDGGGSTTMAIKPKDEDKAIVVNKPSDGSERSVINGVGVFSNSPIGELNYIKISTDDYNMFQNTTRNIVVKGYDEYHNPIELDKSKLVYILEGVEGTVSSNKFKSKSKGKAKISVQYGDISSSIELNVLGTVKDLNLDLSKFSMDINSERNLPVFYGKDERGKTAKIYPEDIDFSTINDIGHVENGVFYSGPTPVAGVLVAKIHDGLRNIIVTVGNEGKLVHGFESLDNLKFASYPDNVLGEINLSDDIKEGYKSVSLKYDFSNGENTRAAYLRFGQDDKIGLAIDGIPTKLGLWVNSQGTGGWLRGTVKDNKGNSHKVDFHKNMDWTGWQYLVGDIPGNVSYPLVLEDIYIAETESGKKQTGEVLLDGLTAFYAPTLGNIVLPTPSALKDLKNIKSEVKKDGFSFSVLMEPKGLNDIVKYDAMSKIKERLDKHNVSLFIKGITDDLNKSLKKTTPITPTGYAKNKHKGVFFLNIDTGKKGIRESNLEQWSMLINDLNSIEESNIIVTLSTPLFGSNGFTDKLEADLLHKYLVETKEKGKDIFVVQASSLNNSVLKDGISYIELNTKDVKEPEDIYNLSILEFVVNGTDITYEINPLFDKPGVKVAP